MTNNFQGKVAFITGAGQGIGLQIAKQLVQVGAVVYLNDRDESLAQRASDLSNKSKKNKAGSISLLPMRVLPFLGIF